MFQSYIGIGIKVILQNLIETYSTMPVTEAQKRAMKKYQQSHPEVFRQHRRKYVADHPEYKREYYYANLEWERERSRCTRNGRTVFYEKPSDCLISVYSEKTLHTTSWVGIGRKN